MVMWVEDEEMRSQHTLAQGSEVERRRSLYREIFLDSQWSYILINASQIKNVLS